MNVKYYCIEIIRFKLQLSFLANNHEIMFRESSIVNFSYIDKSNYLQN